MLNSVRVKLSIGEEFMPHKHSIHVHSAAFKVIFWEIKSSADFGLENSISSRHSCMYDSVYNYLS